jgi:hypothetical protein
VLLKGKERPHGGWEINPDYISFAPHIIPDVRKPRNDELGVFFFNILRKEGRRLKEVTENKDSLHLELPRDTLSLVILYLLLRVLS